MRGGAADRSGQFNSVLYTALFLLNEVCACLLYVSSVLLHSVCRGWDVFMNSVSDRTHCIHSLKSEHNWQIYWDMLHVCHMFCICLYRHCVQRFPALSQLCQRQVSTDVGDNILISFPSHWSLTVNINLLHVHNSRLCVQRILCSSSV